MGQLQEEVGIGKDPLREGHRRMSEERLHVFRRPMEERVRRGEGREGEKERKREGEKATEEEEEDERKMKKMAEVLGGMLHVADAPKYNRDERR